MTRRTRGVEGIPECAFDHRSRIASFEVLPKLAPRHAGFIALCTVPHPAREPRPLVVVEATVAFLQRKVAQNATVDILFKTQRGGVHVCDVYDELERVIAHSADHVCDCQSHVAGAFRVL